jgi:hypothetical protein
VAKKVEAVFSSESWRKFGSDQVVTLTVVHFLVFCNRFFLFFTFTSAFVEEDFRLSLSASTIL